MDTALLEERRVSFDVSSVWTFNKYLPNGLEYQDESQNILQLIFTEGEGCTVKIWKKHDQPDVERDSSDDDDDAITMYTRFNESNLNSIRKFIDDSMKTVTPTEEPTYGSYFQTFRDSDPPMPHSKNLRPGRGEERTREGSPSGSPSGGMGTPANLITDCIQCLAARVGLLESNHF